MCALLPAPGVDSILTAWCPRFRLAEGTQQDRQREKRGAYHYRLLCDAVLVHDTAVNLNYVSFFVFSHHTLLSRDKSKTRFVVVPTATHKQTFVRRLYREKASIMHARICKASVHPIWRCCNTAYQARQQYSSSCRRRRRRRTGATGTPTSLEVRRGGEALLAACTMPQAGRPAGCIMVLVESFIRHCCTCTCASKGCDTDRRCLCLPGNKRARIESREGQTKRFPCLDVKRRGASRSQSRADETAHKTLRVRIQSQEVQTERPQQ